MAAKDLMGGGDKSTRVSGYVNTPIPKKCGTCKFLDGHYCTNKVVMKDPQVPTDDDSKFKIVSPANGCCNEWQATKEAEKKYKE
jgi:hypothetical protein